MSTPSPEFRNSLEAMALAINFRLAPELAPKGHTRTTHYDHPDGFRVITNRTLREATARASMSDSEREKVIRGFSHALNTGGYDPQLLMSIRDLQFEIRVRKIPKGLKKRKREEWVATQFRIARRCSFAFEQGGHITTVYAWFRGQEITDWAEFMSILGLEVGNSSKISKRLKEVVRCTPYFARVKDLVVHLFEDNHPNLPQKAVDGHNVIRKSVALMMAPNVYVKTLIRIGVIKRVNFRCICPKGTVLRNGGLVKGDAIIVPDKQIDCDIYASKHNVKEELRSQRDYILNSAEPHHGSVPAWLDQQTMSWFPALAKPELVRFSVRRLLEDTITALKLGAYPRHMTHISMPKNGDDAINVNHGLSQKWLLSGMKMNHLAALVQSCGGAVKNQLHQVPTRYNKRTGVWFRDWSREEVNVPLTWAYRGYIITDTVLKLAGYDIPAEAVGKLFYHEQTDSTVVPAWYFALYYRNHGGWDLDDSAMILVRMVDGARKAIIIRNPNSWGEWSMIDCLLEGLPLHFEYGDIPELSSDELPTQIQNLVYDDPGKDRSFMQDSGHTRGAVYGVSDFEYAVHCALANPGTGSAINVLCIAWNAIFGDYDRDPLADTEDIVDLCEQTHDLVAFGDLKSGIEGKKQFILDKLLDENFPIDPMIWHRRLNLSDEDKADFGPMINFVDGHPTMIKNIVKEELEQYTADLNELAIKGRERLTFPHVDFRPVMGKARELWAQYRSTSAGASKIVNPADRRAAWRNLNRELTTQLLAMDQATRDKTILATLKMLYDKGDTDRMLVLTPHGDDVSTLDLLIEALIRSGHVPGVTCVVCDSTYKLKSTNWQEQRVKFLEHDGVCRSCRE